MYIVLGRTYDNVKCSVKVRKIGVKIMKLLNNKLTSFRHLEETLFPPPIKGRKVNPNFPLERGDFMT
jgi:hypothetical protein